MGSPLKGDGNVTFIMPLLMLGKVTFDEQVNVLERFCKGDQVLVYFTLCYFLICLVLCIDQNTQCKLLNKRKLLTCWK